LFLEGTLIEDGKEVNDKNKARLLNTLINHGILQDRYLNTDESRLGIRIQEYDQIEQFLGTIDTNAYHNESAIMLNIFIDNSGNDGTDSLNTHKFFYNLWNEWAGQTTLEQSIEDIWNIWISSEHSQLEEVITDGLNRIFERRDIDTFQYDEFRELIFKFINRHQSHSAMAVKAYKTALAKYTLDKMTPAEACKAKKDYYQEELRQSRQFHAQRLQRYRDEEGDLQGAEYDDDGFGNLHLVGQRKDPSTHPSKPQELKNPATKVAPVSAQSVKNDTVISRRLPKNVSLPKFDI
jgi:hypothetical protein